MQEQITHFSYCQVHVIISVVSMGCNLCSSGYGREEHPERRWG